jgi:hypothetical protein
MIEEQKTKEEQTKPLDLKEGQVYCNDNGDVLLITKTLSYYNKDGREICEIYVLDDYGFTDSYSFEFVIIFLREQNYTLIASYPTWQDAVKNDFKPNL